MSELWRLEGACTDVPLDEVELYFFSENPNNSVNNIARAICRSCVVSTECLDDALASHDYFGIRGATTGKERQELNRRAV